MMSSLESETKLGHGISDGCSTDRNGLKSRRKHDWMVGSCFRRWCISSRYQ